MARLEDKEKAIRLRKSGMSYSQIKEQLGLSKSTLSNWLASYPLPPERLRILRDLNEKRIENYRATMRKKREIRFEKEYEKAKKEIGSFTNREILLIGLSLYWAEGYKTSAAITAIANTDPAMLQFYIRWLKCIGVPVEKIRARLHIYSDMNKSSTIHFWKKSLNLPQSCFGSVYVKNRNYQVLVIKTVLGTVLAMLLSAIES